MGNSVYISPNMTGHIRGADDILSMITEVFLGRPSETEAIFYASIFQAGVDSFLVPAKMSNEIPDNIFIRNKMTIIDDQPKNTDFELIHRMFLEHLPDNYWQDKKFNDVWSLLILLVDLCTGLRQDVSILSPTTIPEPESFRGILPPELLLPVTKLLSAISTRSTGSPLPRYEIQKADVQIYREIVESGLFNKLSETHIPLSDQDAPVSATLHRVKQAGSRLQEKYFKELRLSRVGVSLLPLVPKFVDETIGSFPGKVAEHLAKLAQPFLENRRRIVVYDSSRIITEILDNTISYIAMNRDDDAIVRARLEQFKKKHPKRFLDRKNDS